MKNFICGWIAVSMLFLLFLSDPAAAAPVRRIVSEAVETAARTSRVTLDDAMRRSMQKTLLELYRRYGDDAVRVTSRGGIEILKNSVRYGDDFWKAARHAPPAALRSLVLHADDMVPAVRRVGREFLVLEGKLPGLALDALRIYGDDGVRYLSRLPADDAARLIAYGSKAAAPETADALLRGYRRTSGRILRHLDNRRIMSLGLSAAMVTAAYRISGGIGDGMRQVAGDDPQAFGKIVKEITMPFWILLSGCVVVLLLPLFSSSLRRTVSGFFRRRRKDDDD